MPEKYPFLTDLLVNAWHCSIACLVYGALAFFLIRRRPQYLRTLDQLEAWQMRLGIPGRIACFGRSVSESPWFGIFCLIFTILFLLLALVCLGLYWYYRQRLP